MISRGAADCANLLPISNFQKMMLSAATDPETKQAFHEQKTIRWAFRITPKMPPRLLHRGFDKLVARHDSLRLRFVDTESDWRAEALPKHPQGLIIEDLSNLSSEEQDAAILEWAIQPMSALSAPLFEMVLFQCGKVGDVVLMRAHHAIMDGYSVATIIEELLKTLLNTPLFGKPPGHREFIELTLKRLRERVDEKEEFWKARLLPLPEDPQIGRKTKGLPPISPQTVGETIGLEDVLTANEAKQLAEQAKALGTSAFSILHAAFSETICEISDQQDFIVLSVLGRKDAKMSSFVGADMQALFIKYRSNPGQLAERAAWVAQQIADASDQVPTNVFLPNHAIGDAFKERKMPRTRFLVNMGHPSGRLSNSPFKKLLSNGLDGKLSMGFISVERVDLPGQTHTDFEVEFLISQTKNGPNGSLIADAAAFEPHELVKMANGIRRQLGFDQLYQNGNTPI
jgi:hypothetical protein